MTTEIVHKSGHAQRAPTIERFHRQPKTVGLLFHFHVERQIAGGFHHHDFHPLLGAGVATTATTSAHNDTGNERAGLCTNTCVPPPSCDDSSRTIFAGGPGTAACRQFDGDLYTWRRTKSRRRSLTLLPIYVRAFHYSDGESHRDDLSLLFDEEGVLRGVGRRLETEEGS